MSISMFFLFDTDFVFIDCRFFVISLPYYRDMAANVTENLIPIRIDVEMEGHRLKDAFMWNIKGKRLSHVVFFLAMKLNNSTT
jgi:hypothetical protein